MTDEPVGPTLRRLAVPMMWGMASFLVINLADTLFVGRLGAQELAAMAFTFPAVFFVLSVSFGLGAGASSVIARAAGSGDESRVRRLATDSILLALVAVVAVSLLGYFTIDVFFGALGAGPELLPLIREYMTIWYLSVGLVVVPMTGNNALRALGDTKTPARIMITVAVANFILDPLLIFGLGPFPALGLQGAALATAGAYVVGLVAAAWTFIVREKLLCPPDWRQLPASWKAILVIAVPAAFTSLLTPLAASFVTWLAAQQGSATVAAIGVAARVEGVALIGVNALGSVLTPFMGQNLGAGRYDRIGEGQRYSRRFAFLWGLGAAAILAAAAPFLAKAFSPDPTTQEQIRLLLWIVPVTYFAAGWLALAANGANGLGNPKDAMILNLFRLLVAVLPAAWLGAMLAGAPGLYVGLAVGNLLSGAFSVWLLAQRVKGCQGNRPGTTPLAEPVA
ncbi:MAG: MATE family efflux transporter [Thermoplasmatota archaeon]